MSGQPTLREQAMSAYKPPFKFVHGYIYDSQNLMVADDGEIIGAESVRKAVVAARVRGWGKLSYVPNGAAIQDEIGQMIADALNLYYAACNHVIEIPASPETGFPVSADAAGVKHG